MEKSQRINKPKANKPKNKTQKLSAQKRIQIEVEKAHPLPPKITKRSRAGFPKPSSHTDTEKAEAVGSIPFIVYPFCAPGQPRPTGEIKQFNTWMSTFYKIDSEPAEIPKLDQVKFGVTGILKIPAAIPKRVVRHVASKDLLDLDTPPTEGIHFDEDNLDSIFDNLM